MLGDFERMDDQRPVDAGIWQGHLGGFDKRRRRQTRGGPVHHALFGRHESQHAHRFLAEHLKIRRRIANAEDRIARAMRETLPHDPVHDAPRDLAQGRAVEGAKIDNVNGHEDFPRFRANENDCRAADDPTLARKNKALNPGQSGRSGRWGRPSFFSTGPPPPRASVRRPCERPCKMPARRVASLPPFNF